MPILLLTNGYLLSKNCLREVRASLFPPGDKPPKPLVVVHDADAAHGGAPLASIERDCPTVMRDGIFGPVGTPRDVVRQWGSGDATCWPRPRKHQLHRHGLRCLAG